MSKTVRIALAGPGAFGIKHLDGLKNIEGVEVTSIIGRELPKAEEVAKKYGAKPTLRHRFYHVPASNTAVGHMILEEQA
jgi:2-hydroxy-4-carboxymuconate semialdehyde hemiacetal dehydrogenase